MFPNVYQILNNNSAAKSKLGNPIRVYGFGEANQSTARPYCVWQVVSGSTYNYLNDLPDVDRCTVQIDVYADTETSARETITAVRSALETGSSGYLISWGGGQKDSRTNYYRIGFDFEFHLTR